MKILLCFRGDTRRIKNIEGFCSNIIDKIISPLQQNNIAFDTILFTYNNNMDTSNKIVNKLQPQKVVFYTQYGQPNTFLELLNYLDTEISYKTDYDYIVILRVDIIYKMDILSWNIFNKTGLICPYKEESESLYKNLKFYSDTIFIFSKKYISDILSLLIHMKREDLFGCASTLHHLAKYLSSHNIPIETIMDGYYNSHTRLSFGDKQCNPIYIMLHYTYDQPDKHLYLQYLS